MALIKCPKCNSKNISVLKGDGFSIVGADYIAIICNDCKKVYGFNDVKYKPNCSKELWISNIIDEILKKFLFIP